MQRYEHLHHAVDRAQRQCYAFTQRWKRHRHAKKTMEEADFYARLQPWTDPDAWRPSNPFAVLANEYGIDKLRFFIPMRQVHGLSGFGIAGLGITTSSDPMVRTECRIDERRHKLFDAHKLELRAVNDQDPDNYYGSESFYQIDLKSLMRENPDDYQVYALVDDDPTYLRVA